MTVRHEAAARISASKKSTNPRTPPRALPNSKTPAPSSIEIEQLTPRAANKIRRSFKKAPQPLPRYLKRSDPRYRTPDARQLGMVRANRRHKKETGHAIGPGCRFLRAHTSISGKSTGVDNLVKDTSRSSLPVINGQRLAVVSDRYGYMRAIDADDAFLPLGFPSQRATVTASKPSTRGRIMRNTERVGIQLFNELNIAGLLLGLNGVPTDRTVSGNNAVLDPPEGATYTLAGMEIDLDHAVAEVDGLLYFGSCDLSVVEEGKKLPHLLEEISRRQIGLSTQVAMHLPDSASTVRTLFIQIMGDVITKNDYAGRICFIVHEIAVGYRNLDDMRVVDSWIVDLKLV